YKDGSLFCLRQHRAFSRSGRRDSTWLESRTLLSSHVFQDRYRVIGKLGYGSTSTVWLCHDLSRSKCMSIAPGCTASFRFTPTSTTYTHITTPLKSTARTGNTLVLFTKHWNELGGTSSAKVFVKHCAHCISCAKKLTSYTQVCHRFPLPTKPSGIEVIDIQPKNILLGVLDDSAFARATKRIAVSHGLRVKANVTHKGCTTTM
ncbi:hypothetical protein D0863_06816, partial [Hortaea werneckii]